MMANRNCSDTIELHLDPIELHLRMKPSKRENLRCVSYRRSIQASRSRRIAGRAAVDRPPDAEPAVDPFACVSGPCRNRDQVRGFLPFVPLWDDPPSRRRRRFFGDSGKDQSQLASRASRCARLKKWRVAFSRASGSESTMFRISLSR